MVNGTVVITGVTKGLGHAIACEFTKQGWHVAGCGLSSKIIQQMQCKHGPGHFFSVVDITDDTSVSKWANEVFIKIGAPTILINNAALINQPKVLWETQSSEFSEIINTNVIGTFNVLRHFIPLMITQRKGLIINITSGWGIEGEKMFAPYCASKFAIEGLTQSLAEELPKELVVVALDPGGGINTDMLKRAYQDDANNYPTAEQRVKPLVSYILKIKVKDTGKHLTVPH